MELKVKGPFVLAELLSDEEASAFNLSDMMVAAKIVVARPDDIGVIVFIAQEDYILFNEKWIAIDANNVIAWINPESKEEVQAENKD